MREKKSLKNILKRFEWFGGYVILVTFQKVIDLFPQKLYLTGRFVGRLIYLLSGRHRRIVSSNLSLVFGREKGREEIGRITREVYLNVGRFFCEILHSKRYSGQALRQLFILEGKENIDNALKKGKGIIIVSAHLGNFPFIGMRLAREGYPFYFLFREPDAPAVRRHFRDITTHHNVGIIPSLPRRAGAAECLRRLRSNKIVCILADHYEAGSETLVDFLGIPSAVTTGPISLSLKTGAEILPAFAHCEASGRRHRIEICPPFFLKGNDITANTRELNALISSYVLRYPEQWFWLHQRWKK